MNPAQNIGGNANICAPITARFISIIFLPTIAVNSCGSATKIDHNPATDKLIPCGAPICFKNSGIIA